MAGENEILNYEASCNSGFCNKVPLTGYLINNKNVFLKTGRLEVQDQVAALSGSGEESLGDCRLPLCVLSCQKENREFSGVPFIRALMTFLGAPPSEPNHLPKVPPPNTVTLGNRFQHMNFEGI